MSPRTDQRPPAREAPARFTRAAPSDGWRPTLSVIQVVATALAAVTATVAASFLGVAGTVIGAAVASVCSVVGTAVFGHSLRHTRDRVRGAAPARRLTPDRAPAVARTAGPVWAEPTFHRSGRVTRAVPVAQSPRRPLGVRLATGSAALFAALLAVVTGVEAVAHRPLSDILRGQAGSGTSLFGTGTRKSSPPPRHRSPAPTVTRTVTRTAHAPIPPRRASHVPSSAS